MTIVEDIWAFSCTRFGKSSCPGRPFYALTIARLVSVDNSKSKNANDTSSSLTYHRLPANLLLATFEMAGFSDLYLTRRCRKHRSLFGAETASGAVNHALT